MRVSCLGIKKSYEGKKVLENVSLSLGNSEILSVIGPSGAGKTTLLRILATLEKPDEGKIKFFGKEIKEEREILEVRRRIGYVQQKPVLLSGRVYDNLSIPLKIRQEAEEEIEKKVVKVAEMLGISNILKKDARRISGGEAQRVAFARAIITEPEILFLDEFTANLDYRNAGILESLVRDFCRNGGSAFIVSHNLFQVKRLASRVAILIDGKIVEQGEAEKVLAKPETELGRKFISGEIPW